MTDIIPPGRKGSVEIEHFEMSEEEASYTRMRAAVTNGREQAVKPGKYAKLIVDGQLMMTDTQMEQDTNRLFVAQTKGNVLIAGLGIGMVLPPILKREKVDTVLIIEKSQDVIDLVAPHFLKDNEERLFVMRGDILTWEPDPSWSFNTIYFDIWPTICGDNYDEMKALKSRFKKYLKAGGWIGSWCESDAFDLSYGARYGRFCRR